MRVFNVSAAVGTLLALFAALPAIGDNVPFADPAPGKVNSFAVASLGDMMGFVQMRHIKLWYAAKAENWGLADYELAQIEDILSRAATRYINIPVEFIINAGVPLGDIRDAVKAKDTEKFRKSYNDLTAACNGCHTGGGVGFIKIQPPTSSPYSDQAY